LDYWLQGIETGIMKEPEVAIYDNGTGTWRYENEYPLARTEWRKYYLHARPASSAPYGTLDRALPGQVKNPIHIRISV
jgi:predicted acyl esterase